MQDVDEKELIENTDSKCKPRKQVYDVFSPFPVVLRIRRKVSPPNCWMRAQEGPIRHDSHA